ncbi:bifunctional homocysteine S-methyltransferase/methylenetetrahydrofolate reductase [Clostridium grantii]|uniref:Homocysteine S-methyltransferase n=1 Tax=Clostridium grantii DSM 8605 TaxID=1121316 RepID=A0A1M5WX58_9CLOT|nr:bifunctional homocysteine S-methyltransferase/methylenetetrahydrofolate reductase [Clostridium grantii]SHH92081.1 homocysteine S-methyltransferase [Clostridium grantii DSM 8605]
MLKEYLKNNVLITDGAMGTYYSELTKDYSSLCEFANINNPEIIEKIHQDYIKAGAKLIRTNTFSANSVSLEVSREKVSEVIEKGYKIAEVATKNTSVFIGASIGPIPKNQVEDSDLDILNEYKFIVDTFLNLGAKIFVFETFSSLEYLKEISEYIKEKDSTVFILTQFAIRLNGLSRKGISINTFVEEVKSITYIDAYGFNCGSGPTHLYKHLKKLNIFSDIVSVLPNAGYPELVNERTIYVNNPEYFSEIMFDVKKLGAKIIGGCCGTTPSHIKKLSESLNKNTADDSHFFHDDSIKTSLITKKDNAFLNKLEKNEFVIAVELDPPYDTSIEKIMHGAQVCKDNNVDLVTVADSPRAIARVDSLMIAAKIKREIGIDTMPHICCRDKNINALRSGLLATHIEGIRNILAVTGDPVADVDKHSTKSVFNLNSIKLMELISEMNKGTFEKDEITSCGALNLNVINKDAEVSRMIKKIDKGATFFLTQPLYDDASIEYLIKLKKEHDVKILAGIMPIVTYKNAQFLNNEVPGISIPDVYLDRFHINMTKEEAEAVGVNLAVEIANKIKPHVDGLYFITPFNRFEMVMKIVNESNKSI